MHRCGHAILTTLVLVGALALSLRANAQPPPVIVDRQSVQIDNDPEPQEVGPISLFGRPIPEGFDVDLTLNVEHEAKIDVGGQSFTVSGTSGIISSSTTVYLQAGQPVHVTEEYRFTATIDSIFLTDSFEIAHALEWDFVPESGGEYSYDIAGSARDFTLTLAGDLAGEVQMPVIGDTIRIHITTTRQIPVDVPLTYTGKFTGVFERFASVQFLRAVFPPWDVSQDGRTNIVDLVRVAREFGQAGANLIGDVDDDGVVNIIDLVLVARHFGEEFLLAAPAAAPSLPGTRVALRVYPLDRGTVRVDILPETNRPIGGYDVELRYDPTRWEWIDAREGSRLASPLSIPMPARLGRARRVSVSAPVAEKPNAIGPLASFRFRAVGEPDLAAISLRRVEMSDTSARWMPTRIDTGLSTRRTLPPRRSTLGRNFPNPFNPETWIPFTLSSTGPVRIEIYAADGRLLRTMSLGTLEAGTYDTPGRAAHWDGRDSSGEPVSSGIYFYRLSTPTFSQTRRMTVVK